jgi:hypothetical protein
MPLSKLAQEFPVKNSPWLSSFPTVREAFQLPRAAVRQILSVHGRHRAPSSVIAVSRADRSLVVFREGISKLAGLAW